MKQIWVVIVIDNVSNERLFLDTDCSCYDDKKTISLHRKERIEFNTEDEAIECIKNLEPNNSEFMIERYFVKDMI